MEEYLEMISVPSIVVIVYSVIAVINYAVNGNEKFKRFIPLISMGLGVVLAIIAFYAVPTIIPAENIFVAIIIGGASGLSTTGIHQVFKQLKKPNDTEKIDSATKEINKETENSKKDSQK